MEHFAINHNGKLIEVTPIIKEHDAMFVIGLEDKEQLWVDVATGEVKEDILVVGID